MLVTCEGCALMKQHVGNRGIVQTIYTQSIHSDCHEADSCSRQDRVLEVGARGNWCGSGCILQSEVVDTQNGLLKRRIARATPSCIGTFSMRNRRVQAYGAA